MMFVYFTIIFGSCSPTLFNPNGKLQCCILQMEEMINYSFTHFDGNNLNEIYKEMIFYLRTGLLTIRSNVWHGYRDLWI